MPTLYPQKHCDCIPKRDWKLELTKFAQKIGLERLPPNIISDTRDGFVHSIDIDQYGVIKVNYEQP